MNKMSFWSFKNSTENENEVELHVSGEIISDDNAWIYDWFGIPNASPNAFRTELAAHKGKNITVWIDSYGGDVFAGAGIYNALQEHDGKVTSKITKAMSAASVIAMAADEIQMSPVGIMMIHNPIGRVDWGEAKDMRKAADVLDEVKETIVNAYQIKTGKPRNKISEMMDSETFMSAKTAIKEGYADKILYSDDKADPVENNFSFSHLSIQNSMADSMKKFFEVAKNNPSKDTQLPSAPQAKAPELQPAANITNKDEGGSPMFKDVTELRNAHPDLVKQIEDAARDEGTKSERTRIQDIEKISKNLDQKLVNEAKFDKPVDAKDLAFQALQQDNSKGKKYLDDAKADADESGAGEVTVDPVKQQSATEKLEAEDKAADSIANAANRKRGIK